MQVKGLVNKRYIFFTEKSVMAMNIFNLRINKSKEKTLISLPTPAQVSSQTVPI